MKVRVDEILDAEADESAMAGVISRGEPEATVERIAESEIAEILEDVNVDMLPLEIELPDGLIGYEIVSALREVVNAKLEGQYLFARATDFDFEII